MTKRWLWMLASVGLIGCKAYDGSLLEAHRSGTGGRGGAGAAGDDSGGPVVCVPSLEVCNDLDDDCNGVTDDAAPASLDCSFRYHATVACGRGGFCLFVASKPMCDEGWYHCDGLPETGCESTTPCLPVGEDDAGSEDSGAGGS